MKRVNTVVLLLLLASAAQAQFGKASFLGNVVVPAKKIVLVQNDVDPALRDASKYAEEAMTKYWNATKVEFTTKKMSEVEKTKDKELYFGVFAMDDRKLFRPGKDSEKWMMYAVGFGERDKDGNLKVNLETEFLYIPKTYNELDVIWVVRIFNQWVTDGIKNKLPTDMRLSPGLAPPLYRLSETNAGILKTKTLLIDKALLSKKMDDATIKEIYPFPFKIVSEKEILEAIKTGDKKYAVFQSVTNYADETGGLISANVVLDAETGRMLSWSKVTEITVMVKNIDPGRMLLSKSSLKEITKNLEKRK